VILLKIDAKRISGVEFEGYAPWPVDMDRVARRIEALQSVKIEPRQIHLPRRGYDIEPIKAKQDARVELGVDFSRAAFRPQLRKPLASESPDHIAM
jgi:hypothetical protein